MTDDTTRGHVSDEDILLDLGGELQAEEAAALRRHLETCSTCRDRYREVQDTLKTYRSCPDDDVDDVTWRRLLLRAFDAGPADLPKAPHASSGPSTWLRVAAAFVLVLLGALLGRGLAPGSSTPEIVELRRELREVRTELTLMALRQPMAGDRLRALAGRELADRTEPLVVEALLDTLSRDPSPNVRLAVIDHLYALPELSAVTDRLIEILPAQPSPVLRIALIDLLVAKRERRTAAALLRLAGEDASPAVRQRAERGARQLL